MLTAVSPRRMMDFSLRVSVRLVILVIYTILALLLIGRSDAKNLILLAEFGKLF